MDKCISIRCRTLLNFNSLFIYMNVPDQLKESQDEVIHGFFHLGVTTNNLAERQMSSMSANDIREQSIIPILEQWINNAASKRVSRLEIASLQQKKGQLLTQMTLDRQKEVSIPDKE